MIFLPRFPDSLDVPSSPLPSHALPANLPPLGSVSAAAPAAPPEISLPSDKHFSGLPASVGPASFSPVTAQATPPAVPGVIGTAVSDVATEVPSFSFLQEARPHLQRSEYSTGGAKPQGEPHRSVRPTNRLGRCAAQQFQLRFARKSEPAIAASSERPTQRYQPWQRVSGPHVFVSRRVTTSVLVPSDGSGPVPAAPDLPANAALLNLELLPQEFSRSPELTELAGYDSFGFLDGNRNLHFVEPTANLEPIGIEPDVPRDLNLSSYPFDAEAIKRDFPILRERVNGRPLVWLDNAATTQKPQSVIDRLKYFYEHENSNVHRAAHELAARATDAYESAREKVRRFVNASSIREIVFVRGATEGINLIAQSWGRRNIQKDDEIGHHLARTPREHRSMADALFRKRSQTSRCARG